MRLLEVSKAIFDSRLSYGLARWALALVFLYAGAIKLADLEGFAEVISDYGLVPEATVHATAVVLIALELVAGIGLAFDLRGALAVVSALLVLFGAVLAYGIFLGLEIECGCFGPGGRGREGTAAGALSRDVVFLALCGYLYRYRLRHGIRPRSLVGCTRRVFDPNLPPERS